MSLRLRSFAMLACSSALVVGSTIAAQTTQPTQPTYPLQLITAEGEGPALFLGESSDAARVGFVSGEVPVEVIEAPANGRVLVRIRGAMRVRAHLTTERLAAVIQRRGRIRGTPIYVGPGSRVRVLGIEQDGRARISATATLGTRTYSYEGTYPVVGLGATVPEVAPADQPPGELRTLVLAQPTGLLDAPNGTVLETIAPGSYPCRVVQSQDGFHSVILGDGVGPFLTGFIAGELASPTPSGRASPARSLAGFPRRLRADSELPLVRLGVGTRVTFEGATIALLDRPGFARVIERHADTNEADVFVAVDDDVAVRGMVDLASLGEPVR